MKKNIIASLIIGIGLVSPTAYAYIKVPKPEPKPSVKLSEPVNSKTSVFSLGEMIVTDTGVKVQKVFDNTNGVVCYTVQGGISCIK